MKIKIHCLFFSLMSFFSLQTYAQGYKDYYKQAQTLYQNNKYPEALEKINKALELEKKPDALALRSDCNLKMMKYQLVVNDLNEALIAEPSNKEFKNKLAMASYLTGDYQKALNLTDDLVLEKNYKFSSSIIKSRCYLALKKYSQASDFATMASDAESKSFLPDYLYAVATDSANNKSESLKYYDKAILKLQSSKQLNDLENEFKRQAYLAPAYCAARIKQPASVKKYAGYLLIDNPEDAEALLLSGRADFESGDLNSAFEKFTKVIFKDQNNCDAFLSRAEVLLNQQKNEAALSDINRSVLLCSTNSEAYYLKHLCLDRMNKQSEALEPLETAIRLQNNNTKYTLALKNYKSKLISESFKKSKIQILTPAASSDDKVLYLAEGKNEILLKGNIVSENKISKVLINDQEVGFNAGEQNSFEFKIVSGNTKSIHITAYADDINFISKVYELKITESVSPVITISSPLAENGFYNPELVKDFEIMVQGRITDQSLISEIKINNQSAQYNTEALNPEFSSMVKLGSDGMIKIDVRDIYGNVSQSEIRMKSSVEYALNPMGKTWVVFIENSNYQKMPSISNVSDEIAQVKNALKNYLLDTVIVKKNLTKSNMEKFFAVDLKNLLVKNQVNSLLIWFAGHGKVTSDNGYWLPIDAGKGMEETFFATSSLKGYLATYKTVSHTLVVADASETGPVFYLAMRDTQKPRECGNYAASKLRSAQVISSGTTEKSAENSVLSSSFASALNNCSDNCISVDKISDIMDEVSRKMKKAKPRFGVIKDMNDNNGTFYFIKK